METILAYGVPLATVVGGCWLLAAIGVACDIFMARRWRSLWWVPVAVVFGPLAAIVFVATWQRRELPNSTPAPALVAEQPPAQLTEHGASQAPLRSLQTIPMGSGLFLVVRHGSMQDAYRSREIPAARPLVVRRATGAEDRAGPGELLLHDQAVSRQQHFRLQRQGDQIVLEDTSTNGTFIDDQQIVHTSATISVGSLIYIGTTELLLSDERQVFPTVSNTVAA